MKQSWWREKPLDNNKILIIFLYISKKTPQIRFLQEIFGRSFLRNSLKRVSHSLFLPILEHKEVYKIRVGHLMYKINVK